MLDPTNPTDPNKPKENGKKRDLTLNLADRFFPADGGDKKEQDNDFAGQSPLDVIKRTTQRLRGQTKTPDVESYEDLGLGSLGDSTWDNLREGFQQGKQGLVTGFKYTVGEVADRIGFDEYGERVKKKAIRDSHKVYEPDGSKAQFLASMVPSIIPTAVAIGAAPFTGGGSLLGTASILGLSSSAAGNGMMEYEAYQKSKGREVDENKKLAVGLAYGAAEGVFERIQLGKLMPFNPSKLIWKGNVKAAEEVGEGILQAYKKSNPKGFKSLMRKVRDGAVTEGMEEGGTEIAQFATDYLYHDLEDRPELIEHLPKQVAMAVIGGSIMGSALGPLSYGSQNLTHQKRRRKQGEVVLAQDAESGEAYEVVGTNEKQEGQELTYQVMNKDGEVSEMPASQIGEVARLTPDQFDKLLQDKLDAQEHERNNREPKTLAMLGDTQVEVVGPAEKEGRVYVRMPDGSEKSITDEELSDVQEISADEQILGEGREIIQDPVGPVEATRDGQNLIETEEGDFLYPGDKGYEEAKEKADKAEEEQEREAENTRTIDIGKGRDARRVSLTPNEDGSYSLSGLTEVDDNSQPIERSVDDLTETEINEVADQLNKNLTSRGLEAVVELSDPNDRLSPSTIKVYEAEGEQIKKRKLDQYAVKADGSKVQVVNTKTGKKVGPRSRYYLQKIKEYFIENAPGYSELERATDVNPNITEANFLERVASESENPVEISEAYMHALTLHESEGSASNKDIAIAEALKEGNISRKQLEGRGLDKIYKGIAYANYAAEPNAPSSQTMGLDELSEILTGQLGQTVTEDDLMDFIRDNPGGPSSVINKKHRDIVRLEDAFREVTGVEISKGLAEEIVKSAGESVRVDASETQEAGFESISDEDVAEVGAQSFTEEVAAIEQELRKEGVTDEEIETIKKEADELTGEEIEALESEVEAETEGQVDAEPETETTQVEEEAGEVSGQSETAESGVEVDEKERRRNIVKAVKLEGKTVKEALVENGYVEHGGILFHPSIPKEAIDNIEPSVLSEARNQGVQYVGYGDQRGKHGELVSMTDSNGDIVYGMKLHESLFSAGKLRLNHIILHETGHVIWESKLSEDQKNKINAIDVKSNYANSVGDASLASSQEENFAEQYASSKTNELFGETFLSESEIDRSVADVYLRESTEQAGDANIDEGANEADPAAPPTPKEVASEEGGVTGEDTPFGASPDSDTTTRTDKLSAKEKKLSDELSDLFDEFDDLTRGQANIGIDPKMIQVSGKIIAKGAELGYVKIQQFADWVINRKGADFWKRIFPNFKAAYSANVTMRGNPNDEDLNAIAKSTAEDYISDETTEQLSEDIGTDGDTESPTPDISELKSISKKGIRVEIDGQEYNINKFGVVQKVVQGKRGERLTLDGITDSKVRDREIVKSIAEDNNVSFEMKFEGKNKGETVYNWLEAKKSPSSADNAQVKGDKKPNRKRNKPLPEPKDGWQGNMIKAREYAGKLGIPNKTPEGRVKSKEELVSEIDAFLNEETTEGSSPKARSEIKHGLKMEGESAFKLLSEFIDLKDIPEGYYQRYGEKGDAIMPLTVERQRMNVNPKDTLIDPDAYYLIVEQFYVQNGDVMSDPRVDFLVYPNLGLAFPHSFTNSAAGVYEEYTKNGFLSMSMSGVVDFMEDSWMPHITQSGLLERAIQKQEGDQGQGLTNELKREERLFVDALRRELVSENQLNKRQLEDLAQRMGVMEGDKRIKELAEYAIIERARELADTSNNNLLFGDFGSVERVFNGMVNLYKTQPNLTARTSTSIRNQQYSTPAPIAYLMGVYTNLQNGVAGFEPSAGNGLLTIAAGKSPRNVRVNEIDSDRLSMLRLQDFHSITEQDGTEAFPLEKTQQAIVTNPPFGATDARYKAEVMGRDIELSKLEHVMAARALDTMRDDGKAAILIGGNDTFNKKGNRKGQDRSFFHFLHHYYNVDDVFNFGGNVFNKQGANFPTRVILINGRKETPEDHAPMNTEGVNVITDLSTLYEQMEPYLTEANHEPILQTELDAGRRTTGDLFDTRTQSQEDQGAGATETVSGKESGGTDSIGEQSGDTDSGSTSGGVRISTGGDGTQTTNVDTDGGGRNVQQDEVTQTDGKQGENELQSKNEESAPRNLPREKSKLDIKFSTDDVIDNQGGNVIYSPLSDSETITTEMPASMAFSVQKTLTKLANEVGNVDSFVANQLGYKDVNELYEALAGEQVDAVALAIKQVQENKSLIVGDQTGIGKGRVAASMIRYAKQNGLVPVFFTEKDNLFTDMHRDLVDIGSDYKPFIVNANSVVNDQDGNPVYRTERGSKYSDVLNNPDRFMDYGYDYIAITYSQISSARYKKKRAFVEELSPRSLIIMDESHNASGSSNTGEFMMDALDKANGAVYLSATFAKRPDNIPVYAIKTDISEAAMGQDEMIEAIEQGGVALQEIISSDLVESGQMLRRQRSFKGVKRTFEAIGMDNKTGKLDNEGRKQRELYDETSEVLRDIINFQQQHVKPALNDLADDLSDTGITEGTDKAGVDNQPFVSRIHHVVNMLLFSVKADAVADRAIEVIKSGRKPVIAVSSTMESVLDDTIGTGESIDNLHFGHVLTRAIDSVMKYKVTDGISGDDTYTKLDVSELSPTGRAAYERISQKAMNITEDLQASPIDYIIDKIERAGYSIGEVTGRKRKVVYDDNGAGKAVNRTKEESDKNTLFDNFNDGTLDGLLLNSSGATGASAHSSEKFNDRKQRVMIIHQPELNINTEVQKWGRIFRTGQVNLPEYQYITSAIPAEMRLMMVLKKKIKSLDANTTSSQDTSSDFMDSSDFINKYGDEIVTRWLKDNPEIHARMEKPINKDDWAKVKDGTLTRVENIAMKATGRLAFLPSEIQESFYEEISQAYENHIESLNEMGENELVMDNVDLQAETIEQKIIVEGSKPGTPFGGHTYLEKIKAKVLRKPYKQGDIAKQVKSELDGRKAQQYRDDLFEKAQRFYKNREAELIEKVRASETYTPAEKKDRINDIKSQTADEIKRLDKKSLNFIPGEVYIVPADSKGESGITNSGVFLGYTINPKASNPYSASAIKIRFAVNSSQRTISAPTSFNGFVNAIIADSAHLSKHAKNNIWEAWDEKLNTKGFENRNIITGNILQGLNKAGNKGQLIQYTTNDGKVKNGILLPVNMKDKDLKSLDSVRIKANEAEPLVFNLSAGSKIEMSGDVIIKKSWGGAYQIDVPSSKKRGKRYFDDDALLDLVEGEFVKKGSRMRAEVPVPSMGRVLSYLTSNHSIYADVSRSEYNSVKDIDDSPMFKKTDLSEVDANTEAISNHIESLISNWKGRNNIHVIKTEDDIPWIAKQMGGKRDAGVFLNGQAYVFAHRLDSIEKAERTLLHEAVGHLGFRSLLQDQAPNAEEYKRLYSDITLSIYEQFKDDPEFQRIKKLYGYDYRYTQHKQMNAEEFLAHMAERGDMAKSFVDKVVQWLKDLLADLGFKTKLSRADLIDLITDARRYVDSDMSVYSSDGNMMRAAYKRDTAQPFFSQLEQTLEGKLSGRGTAKSYKQQIEGFERKGDFRKAEIEWVGLYEWLDEQSGKLSREDVVGFVRDNNVQMEEVIKESSANSQEMEEIRSSFEDQGITFMSFPDGTNWYNEGGDIISPDEFTDEQKELARRYYELSGEQPDTKYADWQLPGGMDYKEMLITLPLKGKMSFREWVEMEYGSFDEMSSAQLDLLKDTYDRGGFERGTDKVDYRSSHWNEPNVLAHVRFNTREGDMLFLEEIQSDWHQEGREKGYNETDSDVEITKISEEEGGFNVSFTYGVDVFVGRANFPEGEVSEDQIRSYLSNIIKDKNKSKSNKVPNAPFKSTWHELVIKRMIRYAAENGFQKVGWAPGEVHNERYDLSKQVDEISFDTRSDNENHLEVNIIPKNLESIDLIVDKNTQEVIDGRSASQFIGNNLSDVVGKEIADKVMKGDAPLDESNSETANYVDSDGVAQSTTGRKVLKGVNLEVGGEGMKGFYDKILPRYLNKYLKKWDSKLGVEKVVTGDIKLNDNEDGTFDVWDERVSEYKEFSSRNEALKFIEDFYGKNELTQDIWSFPVTPAMMESVMGEGQPMFKKEGSEANEPAYRQSAVKTWFSEIGGNPLQERPHQYQKLFDGILRSIQNKFVDGKRIQEGVVDEGGVVSDKSNFVQDEENHYGRIETLREEVQNTFINPLIGDMRELYENKDVKYADFRDYLYAMHAPERNADLLERNPEGGDAQSGMKDAEAADILRSLEQRGIKEDLEKVAEHVYGMNNHTLRMQFISRKTSKKRFGALLKKFDYYVPLRGFEELQDIDPTMYSFDRQMEGRGSKAGDILAYVQAMSDTAIIHGEKNRVKLSFFEFVKDNYERTDLFRIHNVYWKNTGEVDPETGKEKWIATFETPTTKDLLDGKVKRHLDADREQELWDESTNIFEEKAIKVYVDGRPVLIEVTKPHLARAFANMDVEHMPKFLSATASAMNWIRNVVTQYSPEFGLRNIIRDSWTGMINVSIDKSIADAAKIVNPVAYGGAMKALRNYYRKGEFDNSEWGKAMKSYMKHGSVTGYWQLNKVKDHTKNLKRAIERNAFNKGTDGIKALGDFLDDYNRVLENVARLSAFKHLHYDKVTNPETGKPYTAKQAANYARNLTVNFNRKGNSGSAIGTLYLFFNATVQGIARQAQPFFSSDTRIRNRAIASPIIMGGTAFMFAELMRIGLGKDDDDEWKYDKINDFTRTHNIIVPNWFSEDEDDYLRVPLPYGYNVYWAAGDAFNRVVNGSVDIMEGAIDMAATTVDAYNPIGTSEGKTFGGSAYKSLLPTLLKPGYELITNADFAGNKIKPEPFPFSVADPKSQQHYKYVSTWAKETAQWLNRASGGDQFTEGYVDVSPEHLEYMANFFGGGPARFIDGLISTGENAYDHITGIEDMELYDIYDMPFVRSFYGKVSRRVTRESFIDNQMEVKKLVKTLEDYYSSGQTEKARSFENKNSTMIGLWHDLKAIEKQQRLLRKMMKFHSEQPDAAKTRDAIKKVVESQRELYLEFNRLVNEAKGRAGRVSPGEKIIKALQNEN